MISDGDDRSDWMPSSNFLTTSSPQECLFWRMCLFCFVGTRRVIGKKQKGRNNTNGKILFEVVLKEMMFVNKNGEGMFKGKCFNDVMEVVRSRIRFYGGS